MSDVPSRDRIEAHTVMQKLRQLQKEIDEIPGGGEGGEKYAAGEGISIVKGVISNTDHYATTSNTARLGTLADSIADLEDTDVVIEADISKLKTEDADIRSALNGKQDTLTPGANITIENNVISAVGGQGGTTYQAGDGISIEGDVISNTDHDSVTQLKSSYTIMVQDILRLGNRVTTAETDADSALTKATSAVSTANSANSRALSATSTADTALSNATDALIRSADAGWEEVSISNFPSDFQNGEIIKIRILCGVISSGTTSWGTLPTTVSIQPGGNLAQCPCFEFELRSVPSSSQSHNPTFPIYLYTYTYAMHMISWAPPKLSEINAGKLGYLNGGVFNGGGAKVVDVDLTTANASNYSIKIWRMKK